MKTKMFWQNLATWLQSCHILPTDNRLHMETISYQEKLVKFKDNALCLVSQISIKGYLETIALEPNNGLLIHEGNSNSLPLQ